MIRRLFRLIKACFHKEEKPKTDEELYLEGIYDSLCSEPDAWKLGSVNMTLVRDNIEIMPYSGGDINISGQSYSCPPIYNQVNKIMKHLLMKESLK